MFYSKLERVTKNVQQNDLNKVYEKSIPHDKLLLFHKKINNFLKNKKIIVKGGRALNKKIDIYDSNNINYIDYDLYSRDPKKDLLEIGKILIDSGIKEITVENIIFKPEIFRLTLYKIPFIDVEPVTNDEWEKLSKYVDDDIIYINQNFQKIDMYIQMGRPTLLNISNWDKVLPRLKNLNNVIRYENRFNKCKTKIKSCVKDILNLLDNDCVLTGNIAYYHKLVQFKNDIFFPDLNYVEIFTHKIEKYVKLVYNKYGKDNITIKNNKGFMNILSKYTTIYYKDKPIFYLYYLDDCINYDYVDGRMYSSYYHLMFYYSMIKFFKKCGHDFQDNNITETLLYNLHSKLKDDEIHTNFFGNRNPGIMGLYKMFIKKKKDSELFRWDHRMIEE